jgi:N-acylneuraminate-9-phosphatase
LALVMITNGHHRVQRDKLAAVRAHELFPDPNSIIVGGEEVLRGGEEKPARSIFLKACGVAGCAPHEAAHVGDSLATDVQVRRERVPE